MEETITFSSGNLRIEGLLQTASDKNAVVITHPHPLYGGSMHNNVVTAICNAYQKLSRTTLRSNFRGVGNSQGSYGDGLGEQADVGAAGIPGRSGDASD
jgi:alpha/beta superfamily hydrolase